MGIVKEMLIVMVGFALFIITTIVVGQAIDAKMKQSSATTAGLNVVDTWYGCYAKEDGIPYECDYLLNGKNILLEKHK